MKLFLSSNNLQNFKRTCFFFLSFSILSPFISYSQKAKEPIPLFILQGKVKLQGKPVDGVSLELTKDGKQISRIITQKNSLYSFQMNKSKTDKETEYLLTIIKEGAVSGELRINTYSSKEESFPYIFNLEINLTSSIPPKSSAKEKESGNNSAPSFSDVCTKHDFGKIKWDEEREIFAFDKDDVRTIEKNKEVLKVDSSQFTSKKETSISDTDVNKEKEGALKQKNDSSAIQQLTDNTKTILQLDLKDTSGINRLSASGKTKEAVTENKEPEVDTGKPATKETANEITNTKSIRSVAESTGSENLKTAISMGTNNPIHKSEVLKKKTNELVKVKTIENNAKPDDIKENKVAIKIASPGVQVEKKTGLQPSTPAEKSKMIIDKNYFDGTAVFSLNNEKSRLLNEKEKMEIKKAANLAKKYETNNILTSLLDRVEEYETRPITPKGKENQ